MPTAIKKQNGGKVTPKRAGSPAAKRKKTKKSKASSNAAVSGPLVEVTLQEVELSDDEDGDVSEDDTAFDEDAAVATWLHGADDAASADHAAQAAMALATSLRSSEFEGVVVGVIGSNAAAARCAALFGDMGATVATTASGEHDADAIFAKADVVALHEPLSSGSAWMINQAAIEKMKPGVMLLAPSPLCDVNALVAALETGRVGHYGALGRMASNLVAKAVHSSFLPSSNELATRVLDLRGALTGMRVPYLR
jgi:hypothetical protein